MDVTSFDIPTDSLDFLFSREKDFSIQPLVFTTAGSSFASCGKKFGGRVAGTFTAERAGNDIEEEELPKVEFCWCYECNEEFLSREELRLHSRKHVDTGTRDGFERNDDLILSSEEYKLLSGEVSLLKNRLCCGKCQKEFASEKKLVRHIKKYDFQCEHRSFVNLNNHLRSLKTKRAEDSALMDTQGKDSTLHVNLELCDAILPMTQDTLGSSNDLLINNKYMSDNGGDSSLVDVRLKVRQREFGGKVSSCLGSLSSSVRLCKQDEAVLKANAKKGAGIVNHETLATELNQSERVVICNYCTKPYFLKSKLREHIVVCHLSLVSHKCSICHTFFPTESELKVHEAIHFSKSKYICSCCYNNFSSKTKVLMHMKNVHNMDKGNTCSACFVCFPSKPELGLHHNSHSLDKKYCCSKCGKRFMVRWYYRIHVRVCQLGQHLHNCGKCGKEFLTGSDLKAHLLIHGTHKKFACHICPMRYMQSSTLSRHIRNFHLKLKPHECGICKKRFGLMHHLRQHYAVHSDHRPFKCKNCGKFFKNKKGLYCHSKMICIS